MLQNQNAARTPNYLKFNSLPKAVRERLVNRARGQSDGFAFKTGGIILSLAIIPLAILWLGTVFYLAEDYLWGNFETIAFGIISLVTIYLLLHNSYRLIQWFTSDLKSCLLITPYYIFDISFNDIWYWSLEQLIAPNSIHRYKEGRYVSTQVALSLEGGATKTFVIKSIENADDIIEQIYHFKKLFAEATAKNDAAYLAKHDDFIELRSQPRQPQTVTAPNRNLRYLLTAAVSIVLAAGLMFGVTALNIYYDDKKSWNDAESANRAASFRKYLQTHLHGRWTNDAGQRLQGLYEIAETKYRNSLGEGYDRQAAEAVSQVLNYAKQTQNYHTQIVFERFNEIPPDIVEELKKEFEVKKVLSLGDTFSDAKMSRRQDGLFGVVADGFRKVIPDDILEFSTECAGECVIFTVKYKIGAKDSLYYDTRQKDLSDEERTFYPGIFINWNFNIKIPNQPQNYNFELASIPAEHLDYDGDSDEITSDKDTSEKISEADKNHLYDSMVASAFDDFKANLVYRMGIGAKPPAAAEDEPASAKPAPARKKNKRK